CESPAVNDGGAAPARSPKLNEPSALAPSAVAASQVTVYRPFCRPGLSGTVSVLRSAPSSVVGPALTSAPPRASVVIALAPSLSSDRKVILTCVGADVRKPFDAGSEAPYAASPAAAGTGLRRSDKRRPAKTAERRIIGQSGWGRFRRTCHCSHPGPRTWFAC